MINNIQKTPLEKSIGAVWSYLKSAAKLLMNGSEISGNSVHILFRVCDCRLNKNCSYLLRAFKNTIFGFALPMESDGKSATNGWADLGSQCMMLSTHCAEAERVG